MASFGNRKKFRRWLVGKSSSWAAILALRTALRILPTLLQSLRSRHNDGHNVALSVLRANAAAWAAIVYSDPVNEIATTTAEAANAAFFAGNIASCISARTAAHAAFAAYAMRGIGSSAAADNAAADAAVNAAVAAASENISIWTALNEDATFLENGGGTSALGFTPLWSGSELAPEWALYMMEQLWQALRASNADWGIWEDWYRSRLNGYESFRLGALADKVDYRIAAQSNEWWDREPEAVNEDIVKLVASLRLDAGVAEDLTRSLTELGDTEPQVSPSTFGFRIEDGRIYASPIGRIDDSQFAQDLWSEVLKKTKAARERLVQSTAPLRVLDTIDRFILEMGTSISDVRPGRLLSRSRSLDADLAMLATAEYRNEMTMDAQVLLRDVADSVSDLRAIIPALLQHETEKLAREIVSVGMNEIQQSLDSVVVEARISEVVDVTAIEAFEMADIDIVEVKTVFRETSIEAVQAEAEIAQSRLLATKSLDIRAFSLTLLKGLASETGKYVYEAGGRVRKGSLSGIEETAKILPKAGLAILAANLLGPFAGLAVLGSFDRLKKQFESEVDTATKNKTIGSQSDAIKENSEKL